MSDIILFSGGIGLFIFGMLLLEESLKSIGSSKIKVLVEKYTNNIFGAVIVGVLVTALIQSSSAITLIVLALVSAGVMPLRNAMGIILGANLGTTATAWLITILGFKVKILVLANPAIAIGAFGYMFVKNPKMKMFFMSLVGFGMMFVGLDFMKDSMNEYAKNIDLTAFKAYGVFLFIIVGALLTAVIQSSSATTAITLTAFANGIISLEESFAFVVGANIGTTITAWFGAIGSSADKKRLALYHTIFNLVTAVAAFFVIKYLTPQILKLSGYDGLLAISLFHTIFNLIGIVLMLPFVNMFLKLLQKLFYKKDRITKYITDLTEEDEESIRKEALQKELHRFTKKSLEFYLRVLKVPKKALKDEKQLENRTVSIDIENSYQKLKTLGSTIEDFAIKLNDTEALNRIFNITSSNKSIKDISLNIEEFSHSDNKYIQEYFLAIRQNITKFSIDYYRFMKNGGEIPLFKSETIDISTAVKKNEISPYISITILNVNRNIELAFERLINIKEN
jgi:phosphate:Na+ symporter